MVIKSRAVWSRAPVFKRVRGWLSICFIPGLHQWRSNIAWVVTFYSCCKMQCTKLYILFMAFFIQIPNYGRNIGENGELCRSSPPSSWTPREGRRNGSWRIKWVFPFWLLLSKAFKKKFTSRALFVHLNDLVIATVPFIWMPQLRIFSALYIECCVIWE